MALSTAQSAAYTKLRQTSSSGQAVALSDSALRALISIAARDLGLDSSVDVPTVGVPGLYDPSFSLDFTLEGDDPRALYERVIRANPEAETFIACAAAIHKARLKYQRVLASQPLASTNQVAPRVLLQYGQMDAHPLAALLVWRKWLYDLDNRAAQETGYLFEPVIAGAIGGVPFSAEKSGQTCIRRGWTPSRLPQGTARLRDQAAHHHGRKRSRSMGRGVAVPL